MFETAGALAIVRPVSTLAGLVYCPLLWAVLGALVARWHGRERRGAELVGAENVRALFVAATCSATTLCFAIFAVVQLAMLPSGHRLVQHVSQLARLGQLDLAMALSLDGRSAVFALVIALIAAASAVHTSLSARAEARERLAWTGLLTAGAMLVCVGDGLLPILVGLGILTLGAWGLSRGGAPSPNAVALTGNASIFLGFVFLFWSLGGAFGPEGYDPDDAPRFVLVTTSVPSGKDDQALLSMTTHAGTLVSSDDADLPGEPVRSPFAVLVPPGIYTLRVQGGVATADVVVPRVALVAGRSHVLAPYGPTASLRVLDDQINVPRLTSAGAPATVRAVLSGRSINGLRASAIVLLLVLGGAMAHLHAFASRRGPSALGAVFETIPAAYLALRLSPLADPSHADGILLT
ncbi:MAG TPA: hypothetical protein VM580_17550, partial [Labilithrix sp.]|nr:hypothetical protein [Labilithrix sp.]